MDSSSNNTTKPMGELVSNNNRSTSLSISTNNNININIGGSSSNNNNSSTRIRSKEMENLSFEISKYPRDLLQRFLGGNNNTNQSKSSRINTSLDDSTIVGNDENDDNYEDDDEEGGLNLGLGLSLGGKFGIDKYNSKGLIRSSSIASTMPIFKEEGGEITIIPSPQQQQQVKTSANHSLARTSSLPVETEEEWRKRKEMQTLRRMEAKRRRSEKQRVFKDGSSGGNVGGGNCVEEKSVENLKFRGRLEREQQSLGITNKFIGSSMGNLFGSSTPLPPTPSSANVEVNKRRTTFGSLQGFLIAQGHVQGSGSGSGSVQVQGQQGSSQGSGESQGGTSSGASELESKTHQASSSCGEAKSPASIQSQQERLSQEALPSPVTDKGGNGPETESSSKQPRRETGTSTGIEDMPCVFTIGDGPNGRKVEGILYRYGKGEQVRIMCVCHGTFLSPQDFVKHAGGRDVEHPLRHIVVSPSSSAFQ